jgi:ribose transport system permease protein
VLLLFIFVFAAVLTAVTPRFLSFGNVQAILIGMAPDAVIVVGMTFLIVSGVFDLSVGSVLGLSGVVAGLAMNAGMPVPVAVLAGLATGGLTGAINGLIVTRLSVNALIATLGMMIFARSITQVLTATTTPTDFPPSFTFLGQGSIFRAGEFGLPAAVLLMLAIGFAGDFLLRNHSAVRRLFYVGSSERSALLAGVPVSRVRLAAFIVTGALAALAGLMVASRLNTATPTAGDGTELRAISAVVIGGASLSGGEGTVFGALLGCLLLAVVTNALTQLNVSPYWQGAVNGAILVLAVAADAYIRRRRTRT